MKLNRAIAIATILILFYQASVILAMVYRGYFAIPALVFFCIPWVVRKTEKLLKECFDSFDETAPNYPASLDYVSDIARQKLSKLPCRVDEMTKREFEIFKVVAEAQGALQTIVREISTVRCRRNMHDPLCPHRVSKNLYCVCVIQNENSKTK